MNNLPSFRILYIDDDRDSCEMISLMLRLSDESFELTTTTTAEEVLALLESQSFDLYILDFLLPKMTGIELCKLIRQSDLETPILFYSGMARTEDRTLGMAAGADEYLVKPNDLDKLGETVAFLLCDNFRNSNLSLKPLPDP